MLYILLAVAIFMGDLWIKNRMEEGTLFSKKKDANSDTTTILNGKIILEKYHNKGAIFDSFEKWPKAVKIVSGLVMLFVGLWLALLLKEKGKVALKLGLALILGGGASNVYDRWKRGYVVDYFSFASKWKKLRNIVFNISDLFVFLGSLLVLLFGEK